MMDASPLSCRRECEAVEVPTRPRANLHARSCGIDRMLNELDKLPQTQLISLNDGFFVLVDVRGSVQRLKCQSTRNVKWD